MDDCKGQASKLERLGFFFPFSLPLSFFLASHLFILLEEKNVVSYHHDTSLCFSLTAKMLEVPSERTALCRNYREVWRPWGHFCLLLLRFLKSFGPMLILNKAQG